MKHLIRLTDYTKEEVKEIFHIADEIPSGKYTDFLKGKTIVMFFPESSIRTRVTLERMRLANENAVLNPCPPFFRGEEVSEDVIKSNYFVGYEFKKYLLEIQQAVLIYSYL